VFDSFWRRLFFWKNQETLKRGLRSIKQEADHLTAAVASTQGQLQLEDLERLKALTRTLQDATERLKSD
jgi:hypothetical protein